jgi:hypothetical protein
LQFILIDNNQKKKYFFGWFLIGAVPKAHLKLNVKNKSDSNSAFGTASTGHRWRVINPIPRRLRRP